MSYSSYSYLLIFLVLVFIIYTLMPKKCKWAVLLSASYVFYWINSGKLLIFMLLTTVSIYFTGIFLNKIQDGFDIAKKSLEKENKKALKNVLHWQKRAVVILAIAFNFGLLVFLKYYNFLGGSFNSLFDLLNVRFAFPHFKLMLPLGISYYTLQAVSYVIDVYRGKYRADKSLGKVALFLSFFPQIVEGPIGRFDLLADNLYEGHKFNYDNVTQGIQLIFWGMLKKIVIADRINPLAATIFDNYTDYKGPIFFIAGIFYTLQIYAEFSGCMDIVTGSAQIFGVTLSKNFDRPFFSKSINEFWRRWHITLGAWLRDYIFYSVSLSKAFAKLSKWTKKHMNEFLGNLVPAAFALFFVWLGNGFWHGSGWKYISYGMYYYVIMMLGMLCEPLFRKTSTALHVNRDGRVFGIFKVLRTDILVVIGMMLFRAQTVGSWFTMIKSCFSNFGFSSLTGKTLLDLGLDGHDFAIIGIATLALLVVSILQEKGHSIRSELATKNIIIRWTVYFVLIISVIIFGAYGAGYDTVDFIYGQF